MVNQSIPANVDLRQDKTVKVFDTKRKGQQLAKKYRINERTDFPIRVIFPEERCVVTIAFFLGMFSNAILDAGSKTVFENRYLFQANYATNNTIKAAVKELL